MTNSVFLSKFPVHVALSRDPGKRIFNISVLNDAQFRHRAVMSLFGQINSAQPRSHAGILFRLDTLAGQPPYFLVQSLVQPENVPSEVQVIERRLPVYETGMPVRFRIAVNAVRRRTLERANADRGGSRRIQTSPVPFDSQADGEIETMTPWLAAKLAPALQTIEIINHQREVLSLDRQGKAAGKITTQVDTVDGVGLVGDGEALNELIVGGVGRAKAFGCGLLSVEALH